MSGPAPSGVYRKRSIRGRKAAVRAIGEPHLLWQGRRNVTMGAP